MNPSPIDRATLAAYAALLEQTLQRLAPPYSLRHTTWAIEATKAHRIVGEIARKMRRGGKLGGSEYKVFMVWRSCHDGECAKPLGIYWQWDDAQKACERAGGPDLYISEWAIAVEHTGLVRGAVPPQEISAAFDQRLGRLARERGWVNEHTTRLVCEAASQIVRELVDRGAPSPDDEPIRGLGAASGDLTP